MQKRKYPKKEGALVKAFMKEVNVQFGRQDVWWCKVHGEPMQRRGIPDVMVCYLGVFYGIEFKIRRGGKIKITPYQQDTLERISKAKGIAYVIWWDERDASIGVNSEIFEGKNALEKAVGYLKRHMCKMKERIVCFDLLHCAKTGTQESEFTEII